ncbi:MAG: outer membrane beta-barrel protein [Bacteroidales bacterium]|nr:outer membrane beta-barrel protein [Bacteroidales bacterium]
MKKKFLFLTVVILLFSFHFSTTQAQQVIIKGKYNGKMLTVKAQRAPGGDIIESISYAPLDDLKKEVANLKKQRDDLEKKYNGTKKNQSGADIRALEDSLKSVNARLQYSERQLNTLQNTVESLADQLQQSEKELRNTKSELNKTQDSLRNVGPRQELETILLRNSDFLSVEAFFGASFINNNLTKQDFWSRPISGGQKYHLTFTHYFSKSSPVALKTGIGLNTYNTSASFLELKDSASGLIDIDEDNNETRYDYHNVREQATLNYLDVPILLHIGNNYSGSGIQAWVEAGVTLGMNITKSFSGEGFYSSEAYYPEWNVTVRDVPELGLVSNAGIYGSDIALKVNKLVVWANAAIGVFIPLGNNIGVNIGARIDYSLTPLATNDGASGRFIRNMPNVLSGDSTHGFSAGADFGLSIKF